VQTFGTPATFRKVEPAETEDTLFSGALRLLQPARGFRVTVDALLLAAFASSGRVARLALDLGAGTGAIALSLGHVGGARELALVEREPRLARLARDNLRIAGARGSVWESDLERQGLPHALVQRADLVVANPPFLDARATRPRQDDLSRRARSGALSPFTRAAARALAGPRGRACFVYPAPSLPEFLACAERDRLVPKRLRLVHARSNTPARLALIELRLAKPGGLVVEPPLVEWSAEGRRSAELARIVSGRFGPGAQRPSG
jgi:tRNA1Val (adenine37-N6)-methyltransferase